MAISNNDKQALIDGTATIPFRINIIQDGDVIKTLNEHSIVDLNYEDFRYVDTESLVIGQFVARKVTGNLDQIYSEFEIEDTELELQIGVSYDNSTTYYSLGNFLVTKPTTDDVKDKTSFEALDYTKKFNQIFDDTGLTFPCTALELAQYTCDLCGVELETTDFANADFIINDNQYVEADTCRKVMQDIGKLAYSWVRVDWDNKVYIDFEYGTNVDSYNVIDTSHYYDLSLQRKVFGPVNRIVVGMKDVEGENAVIEDSASIQEYGVTELQIYDSNITYTPELRLQVIQAASRLFGLTYTPLEVNSTGHPWLVGNEKIEIKDSDNNSLYTYPFDRTISYNGHIKTKITSKADTSIETEYKNYGNIESSVRKTRIIVDKQNQKIEALAEEVKPISNTISGFGSITLENAYEGTLHRLEIKGDIKPLFPSTTLYPSPTLYPLDSSLVKVDDTIYKLGFTILRYINSSTCDLYVYEDGKQWVERNIGVDENDHLYELDDEDKYIEELEDISIQVSSSSVISLDSFPNANIKAIYLLQNDYTDSFVPTVDVISKINITPGNVAIQSHKIALEGYTTINGNFSVDLEGNMYARNGTFEGNIYLSNGNKVIGGKGLLTNLQFNSDGILKGWDRLGMVMWYSQSESGAQVSYQNVMIEYFIPTGFTVESAYIVLETTPIQGYYMTSSTAGNFTETTGNPKQLKLYKGDGEYSVIVEGTVGGGINTWNEITGTEIPNAFGSSTYTPPNTEIGHVDVKNTIDISSAIVVGELGQLFIGTTVAKPTPSASTAEKTIAENTGVGKATLYVYGYTSFEESEGTSDE